MNYFHINFLLTTLFLVIALLIIITSFNILDTFYLPIIIYFIGLALLLHVSLISEYLVGYDIQREYYFSQMTFINSRWNPDINDPLSGILSITLLPTIFSLTCDISIVWIFKLFYPILYSFILLGLYHMFKNYFSDLLSFYSCIYFISMPSFFYLMPQMARQEIGEIFFLLIIMLFCCINMNPIKKKLLLIIYTLSLIVTLLRSHLLFLFS